MIEWLSLTLGAIVPDLGICALPLICQLLGCGRRLPQAGHACDLLRQASGHVLQGSSLPRCIADAAFADFLQPATMPAPSTNRKHKQSTVWKGHAIN